MIVTALLATVEFDSLINSKLFILRKYIDYRAG